MMTYFFMALFVIGLVLTTLLGVKYYHDKDIFMSVEDSNFLRGFWCIIVILVHVPEFYQNRIQDMLGSFAFIGVTFFFMTSSYGLKWSIEHKPHYLDHFWRKRLPSIMIPALIANAFCVLINAVNGSEVSFLSLLNINDWVKVLLLYYLLFWIIYKMPWKQLKKGWQDVAICSLVVIFSFVDYFTSFKITLRWIVEPLGFAYGIICANHSDTIKKWLNNRWIEKIILLMLSSGFLGLSYLKYKHIAFWGDYLLKIILGIVITLFVFSVISKLQVGNKLNSFIGGVSYEVYLLHHGVFGLIILLFGETVDSGFFIFSSVIVTIIIAYLLKLVCIPFIKGINKIGG